MHYKVHKTPTKLVFIRYSYWQYARLFLLILIASAAVFYFNLITAAELNFFFVFSFLFFFYSLAGLVRGKKFLNEFVDKIEFDNERKIVTIQHKNSAQKLLQIPYALCLGLNINSVSRKGSNRKNYNEYFLVLKFKNGSEWALMEFTDEDEAWRELGKYQEYFTLQNIEFNVAQKFSTHSSTFKLEKENNNLICSWQDKPPGYYVWTVLGALLFLTVLDSSIYYFLWNKTFPAFKDQFPFYIVGGLMNSILLIILFNNLFKIIKWIFFKHEIVVKDGVFNYKRNRIHLSKIQDCYFSYLPTSDVHCLYLLNDQAYKQAISNNTIFEVVNTKNNFLCCITFVKVSPLDILSLNLALISFLKPSTEE